MKVKHLCTFCVLLILTLSAVLGITTTADAQKVHALLIILGNDQKIRGSVNVNESSMKTLLRLVSENCEVRMTVMKSEEETIGKTTHVTLANARTTKVTVGQPQGIITTEQVVNWIRTVPSTSEDTLLVYYNGHGQENALGDHVLGFDPGVTNDSVPRNGIRDLLEQRPGRLKLLITDTCNNRVKTPSPNAVDFATIRANGRRYTENLFLQHIGLLDITASASGQYAWGDSEIGGYFTSALISSFTAAADKNRDNLLSWLEVFNATRDQTEKYFKEAHFLPNQRRLMGGQTTQTPIYHSLPTMVTRNTDPDDSITVIRTTPVLKDMDLIPAGEFQMGNINDGENAKKPVYTVHVDSFYIDRYEVTNAQYKKFVDANPQWGKHRIADRFHDGNYLKHWNGNNYPSGKANHPVVYVSWYAAMAYAKWAGKRLPTEAEREKAARGGLHGKKYPWGNTIDASKANYLWNSGGTRPVGRYSANGYGLYDMVGNVAEWCLDDHIEMLNARSVPENPLSDTNSVEGLINNFTSVTSNRIFRGGGWDDLPFFLMVVSRIAEVPPGTTNSSVGFRCVSSISLSGFTQPRRQ